MGCGTYARGFVGSKTESCPRTARDMVKKPSADDRKYRVKALSKKRFSCGKILSVMASILVEPFFLNRRASVPKAGAIKLIQYRNTTTSNFFFANAFPTRSQFSG